MAEESKVWHTAYELAEILKVSPQTIWRWGKEGQLERLKIGTVTRFKFPEQEGRNQ